MQIEVAHQSDSPSLAELIDLAGEGLPTYLWQGMAQQGQTAHQVGAERAAREEGSFSYRNALVCKDYDLITGMVVSYRLPDPYEMPDTSECPPVVWPLLELEAKVPGSWYINALATYPGYRGKGVAKALMLAVEELAREQGCSQLSLIVAADNSSATGLYFHLGYQDKAAMPAVNFPGGKLADEWILMTKALV